MTEEEQLEDVTALSEEQREYLRKAARHDLYVLGKGILRYPDVTTGAHGAYTKFYTTPKMKADGTPLLRRLGLMPRGHLKSTLATITDSIRLVLADPDEARVLIANETASTAEKFLLEIKGHWEKNQLLRTLFPELVPDRLSGPGAQWSATKASVNRKRQYKEPSWQAIGVGGAIVGAHFTHIKCDDLIGFEASESPARMKYTVSWNDNIESLLVDQHTNIIDWIGTRWMRNDLYSHIMSYYGDSLAVFTRQAIEDGMIIFPELHTWEEYERIQTKTPRIWAAQYANNPRSEEVSEWTDALINTFKFVKHGEFVLGDPGTRNQKLWRLSELDVVMTVDPNGGEPTAPDTAAIVTAGMSPDGDIFVLDAWSGRPSPTGLVNRVVEKFKRWKPRVVGVEKAGQQNTEHYIEKQAKKEGLSMRTQSLLHGNRNKIERIRTELDTYLRGGQMYLLPSQQVLRGAIDDFPISDPIDEVDALAYVPRLLRKPHKEEQVKKNRQALKLIMHSRNPITGY